jgi:hypothetical protein
MSTKFKSKLFYGKTGFFDSIGVGTESPSGNFYISGKDFRLDSGQAYFQYRPLVNGTGVLLIGEVYEGATFSQASFAGSTSFAERPLVNGTGVLLTGDSSFYPASNPSGFITGVDLSSYVTSSQSGAFYPASNPSGFITGVDLSSYVTSSQSGAFYPASNPSGFLTVSTISGSYIASVVDNIPGSTQIKNMVRITQSGYNSISSPASDTLYVIVG